MVVRNIITRVRNAWRVVLNPLIARFQTRGVQVLKDWDSVKEQVIRAKFTQNTALKQLLLSTDNCKLEEASGFDYYWGCDADGSGQNRLGVCW